MKQRLLFVIMITCIACFFLSCRSSNREKENEDYQFYYYPRKNVYYNVEKKNFLYSLDGGKTWDSAASSSDKEPATLGEKIIVYSPDNNVVKDNAAHRKLYNGILYNIIDNDTTLAASEPEVTERKVPKKTVVAKPKQEEEKQLKGLKKFLNKIFGKHKKKQEE